MFANLNKKIIIKSLTLREMPGYKEQYRRPYLTHLDAQTLEMVRQMPAEDQREAAAVAPWVDRVLSYSAPVPSLKVPGGWAAKRNSFVLHVQVESFADCISDYLIAGYTDSDRLDDHTWFVINSITGWQTHNRKTVAYDEKFKMIIQNDHVLADLYGANIKDKQTVMRPAELFGSMVEAGLEYLSDMDIVDTRSLLSSLPRLSKRVNNISSVYYAGAMRAYREAEVTSDFGSPEEDILSHARALVLDGNLSNDVFMRAIMAMVGVPASATFDYEALRCLEPNIQSLTHRAVYESNPEAEGSEQGDWSQNDITTATAANVVQAVPALLVDAGISQLHFEYSNSRGGMGILVFPHNKEAFFDQDVTVEQLDRFKTKLLKEVVPQVTYGNMLELHFSIKCDVFGETRISLKVGNDDLKTFVVPTFADAAFSPMTAPQKEKITENHPYVMAKDMRMLMGPVVDLEPPPSFVKV